MPAAASGAVRGELTQLPGGAGCVGFTPVQECTQGAAVRGAENVVVSPDGAYAYVSQYNFGDPGEASLLAFRRDQANGVLSQLAGAAGCYGNDGAPCTEVRAASSGDGQGLAMSRDGRFLYAASQNFSGITVYARDAATGALTQLAGAAGCLTADGLDDAGDPTCANIRGTGSLNAVALSPNGLFLVASAYGDPETLSVYSRNPATGVLTQLPGLDGCYSVTGVSEDGVDTCTDIHDAGSTSKFAITPDGRHVYAPHYSDDAVAVLDVDPATGKLTQKPGAAGCLSHDGAGEEGAGSCTDVIGIAGPYAAVVTPDGRNLYIGGYDDGAVASFALDGAGTPTQLAGGCVSDDGSAIDDPGACTNGRALERVYTLAVSPDGANLYATADPPAGDSPQGQLAVFAISGATGGITQLAGTAGCVTETGSDQGAAGVCQDGRRLGYYGPGIAPDGGSLYLPSYEERTVTSFSRQAAPVCTGFARTIPFAGRLTTPLPCRDPNGDPVTAELVTPPPQGTATLAGSDVTYRAPSKFTGQTGFTFRGSDAFGPGLPAFAIIDVDRRPTISRLRLPSPFAVAKGRTPVSAKVRRGSRLRFRLSEAAKVRLTVQRPRPGRRVGGKCRKPTRQNRTRRACKRWVKVGRVIRRNGKQGRNSVKFTGRIGRKKLKVGRYRVQLNATDAVGSKAKAKRKRFRVVAPPKKR
jgi:6-phosphogluconolactonase (cycloisomerase 2 family)